MIHRVLDEMELAALVGDAAKTCFHGLAQALMIVAGDETHPVQAAATRSGALRSCGRDHPKTGAVQRRDA
jgi:hypothetical protein